MTLSLLLASDDNIINIDKDKNGSLITNVSKQTIIKDRLTKTYLNKSDGGKPI